MDMEARPAGIEEDLQLIDEMLSDCQLQSELYRAGPYWEANARASAREIKAFGLANFRGMTNLIGQGFTDCVVLDWRNYLYRSGPLRRLFYVIAKHVFPINRIIDNQVELTKNYFSRLTRHIEEELRLKQRTAELLERYRVPYSLLGGCVDKVAINGNQIATHYLNLLSQHDYVARHVDFAKVQSILEIGGGFGVNIHLLLTNYKNIRKILYLDIPPNLYVGTQYLRAFYGDAVCDYREIKRRQSIAFSSDDKLEIFCITPWQIELLQNEVDVLINSHSFVEMPEAVVRNYANKAFGCFNSPRTAIVLTSYDSLDRRTTLSPYDLPGFFDSRGDFIRFQADHLIEPGVQDHYFVSAGQFAKRSAIVGS